MYGVTDNSAGLTLLPVPPVYESDCDISDKRPLKEHLIGEFLMFSRDTWPFMLFISVTSGAPGSKKESSVAFFLVPLSNRAILPNE